MKRNGIGKKGNAVLDTTFLVIVILVMSIVAVVGYAIFADLNTDLQSDADVSTTAKEKSQDIYDRYPGTLDAIFIFAVVLLWILAIVFSFMIDSHPIFFILTIIALSIIFIVGMIMANAYEEMSNEPDFIAYSVAFPMTNWIMSHFLIVIIAVSFSIALALFGKNRLITG